MNEVYAADPKACRSAADLRTLLSWFGPFAGRYLAAYPSNWLRQVESSLGERGDIERARASTLLRRAIERSAVVSKAKLPWVDARSWVDNAVPLRKPAGEAFDALIGTDEGALLSDHVLSFDSYDPPNTSEERIATRPSEFVRVAKTLLVVSPQIHLVDPFLDPLNQNCEPVLAALMAVVARGKADSVIIWARASKVCGDPPSGSVCAKVRDALAGLAKRTGFDGPGQRIELKLVRDESSVSKMHGRYLLSIKGGIRFDQGFAKLPKGRQMDVGPIGQQAHSELMAIYVDGRHDMIVVKSISV